MGSHRFQHLRLHPAGVTVQLGCRQPHKFSPRRLPASRTRRAVARQHAATATRTPPHSRITLAQRVGGPGLRIKEIQVERYAKAITVLVVGVVAYLLAEAGVDIPTNELEIVIAEIVTACLVYLVPNR